MSDRDAALLVGERLRLYRVATRLTQREVADRIGVSLSTVSHIEKGVSGTIGHLIAYLRATGRIDQLNGLVEPPRISPIQLAKNQKPSLKRVRKKWARK